MRLSINLATRPFVELRPLFARLRLAMAALALLGIALGFALHSLNQRARAAQSQMDTLKTETASFQSQRLANEARMRQPQNMAILDRSRFLNAVFARKSFSWTAVMMDLETVLPSGVQVTSIEPVITPEGEVNIRLRVVGDRDRTVQLVRNLETSHRFLAPRLAGEAAQNADTSRTAGAVPAITPGAVEFEIFSGYNPLPIPSRVRASKPLTSQPATLKRASPRHTPSTPAPFRGITLPPPPPQPAHRQSPPTAFGVAQ